MWTSTRVMPSAPSPLRLRLDGGALVANWRWLAAKGGGAACGAAIKADGYGTDAIGVAQRLKDAGCRDYFVATWAEAQALSPLADGVSLSVLHGVRVEDMEAAVTSPARPTLNTLEQIRRWRETGQPCDVMVDTGMNRLGISPRDVLSGALEGLEIVTLMSHLASADEDVDQNEAQCLALSALAGKTSAKRLSLANSAGICLGDRYSFDLTRPGLALYGGIPRPEAIGHIRQVVHIEAQVLQRRRIEEGDAVGYNATFRAERPTELAILNLGYADGYLRGFSGRGSAGNGRFPVIGRVSMDLIIMCVDADPTVEEGDWLGIDYDLTQASAQSGLSPYELLTGLGSRFERVWQ
jgi:alanine racemase